LPQVDTKRINLCVFLRLKYFFDGLSHEPTFEPSRSVPFGCAISADTASKGFFTQGRF
jgi:hypothetical protein